MVQKYQSPVRVYKYPFELLMAAYERRFPTCDMIPIILDTEIIEESEDEVSGVHMIDRRAKLNVDAPYLLKKFMGVEFLLFRQRNTLDKRERTLTIEAWNESFSNRVGISEFCLYWVHPENPEWTCFEQKADLDIKNFFGFEGTAEKLAIKEYSKSIGKSKDIMEHYINVLADEGITSMPIWTPPAGSAGAASGKEAGGPGASGANKPPLKAIAESEADSGGEDGPKDDEATGGNDDSGVSVKDSSKKKDSEDKKNDESGQEGGGAVKSEIKPPPVRRKSSSAFAAGSLPGSGDGKKIDEKSKLEQDYIQMYLGELTPMQESGLVQLKLRVSELLKGKALPSDPVFLRFLRARDFNVEKAREMLSQSLIWRKKHAVDKILNEYEMPTAVREYFPGGWYMNDNEDRPLFILRLGVMDIKGIIKSVGEEGLTKLTLQICEEGLRLTEEASHRLNRPISTWCLLLDLEGLNMRHLWRPGMKALLHIIEICEANYPETLGRVLIIRAPRVFPIMWTLVSPLIDETTRGKFVFYGGNDHVGTTSGQHGSAQSGGEHVQGSGGLADFVDPAIFPSWLGGPKALDIPDGGLVPKSYYMSVEEFEKDQSPGPHLMEDSFYNSASLGKGQVHEGIIHNSDKGSVITWDFDVMRHDVVFTVYRLRIPLPIKSPQVSPNAQSQTKTFTFPSVKEALTEKSGSGSSASGGGGGTASSTAGSTATSSGGGTSGTSGNNTLMPNRNNMPLGYAETVSDHKSVLEKQGGREGHDYYKVEASIVCHDGESIQGSHVTSHVGTYVLQWRFFDSKHRSAGGLGGAGHGLTAGHGGHHGGGHGHGGGSSGPIGDVIDSVIDSASVLQVHKAKIMYYYETLSSADYRGSMTSLQSCQSAFSNASSTKFSKHSTSGVSSGMSSTNHSVTDSSGGGGLGGIRSVGVPTVTVTPSSSIPSQAVNQAASSSSCSTTSTKVSSTSPSPTTTKTLPSSASTPR